MTDILRQRPPRAALAWAETMAAGEITEVHALTGGQTSAVHRLRLRSRDGRDQDAVLRRYVLPDVLDDVPHIVEREEEVLWLLETVDLPTPRFLGSDPMAKPPALLMECLAGQPDWRPDDESWLRGLAEVLPTLHSTPIDMDARLADFAPYTPEAHEPPPWLRRPALWHRALELFRRPIDEPTVLIHRDYHPGNVLWHHGALSGVVDWQAACAGPPSIDVGWCRLELLKKCGAEPAARFTALWEKMSGRTYHPAAEVALLVDKLGMTHEQPPPLPDVHEDLLAKALAELGLGHRP